MLFVGEAVHEEHGEEGQGPDRLHGAHPHLPDHSLRPTLHGDQVQQKTSGSFIY